MSFTPWLARAAFVVGALAATQLTAHAAPLVTNGSFEGGVPAGNKYYFNGSVPGWSGGTGLTFIAAPGTADDASRYLAVYGPFPATSPDGGDFVLADGDPSYRGLIYQTISGLTPGASYNLSFYQAAGQQLGFMGPTTERWTVSLGGETQLSPLFSLPQGGVGPWQAVSMTFTPTATSEILSFLATGTPGGAPPISFLDGVSLTEVPEPATLAVLGLGFVGLLASRRKAK